MSLIEIAVSTPAREVLVDITHRVQEVISRVAPGLSGMVNVFVPHTTAGVTVNEGNDPAVARDIVEGLARFVPTQAGYRHSEGNSDAHIKASLIGNHVAVPVEQGQLRLGTWQSLYLADFDGPRTRKVWIVPMPAAGS